MDEKHRQKLKIAVQVIKKAFPTTISVYVFGSFGTEYETSASDLDLAVLFPGEEKISNLDLWDVSQKIASAIDRDVQLVELQSASTVFRFEILTSGKRIYCKNQKISDTFENVSLSMYLRFQEERKDIIENYG